MIRWLRRKLKKHNEGILKKYGFIHCANCNGLILQSDKYCQYCGTFMEIKSFQYLIRKLYQILEMRTRREGGGVKVDV